MTLEKKERGLDIALLNGIVLTLIGILVLLTPLLPQVQLEGAQRHLDNVAGVVLLAVGLFMLGLHFATHRGRG